MSRVEYIKQLEKELKAANNVIDELVKELFELKAIKSLEKSNPILYSKIINLD